MTTSSASDWLTLTGLIDPDSELADAVLHAVHARAAGDNADPWAALIDGLDDAGVLAYMAQDDSGEELADALAGVPRVFRAGVDLDEVGDIEGTLTEAIARADELLAPHDLRIVYLDERTEDRPLVVVPLHSAEDIVRRVSALGHSAQIF